MNHYILGIQCYASADSGACIIKFSKKTKPEFIAISEERLLRKKYPYTFPVHSILYCMNFFNIKELNDIDFIISDWIRLKRWERSGPSYTYQMFDYIKEKMNFKKKIFQINHHLAHAASVFFSSNFKESAILIVDGNGSALETNSYYLGKGYKIKLIEKYNYRGIGAAYSAVTKDILNFGTGGEGKTMSLAAYGKPNRKIKINFTLSGIKTNFSKFMLRMPYSDILNQINSNYRISPIIKKIKKANKKNILNKIYKDWAYEIQNVSEKVMSHLGKDIYKKIKSKNICLAGGVALNCVANEILIKSSKFKNAFIFPACSDTGIPFGLALWGYYNIAKQRKRIQFKNAYTGKKYFKKEIIELLTKFKIKYKKISIKEIAELISKGKIIGHFSGSSEYGPRSLGNRSILADPRDSDMRNHLNIKVKHREIFRPFAPAILENKCKDYFNLSYSPFMLRASKCFIKSKHIPSVIHVDGTARVQTVNKNQNLKFYKILKEFDKITGIPMILNTSFNDAGEPLIETPLDALICYFSTKIDLLVIDNLVIDSSKYSEKQRKNILNSLKLFRSKKINFDEKKCLKIITKRFNTIEFKKRIKKENKKAVDIVLNMPVNKIETFFKEQNINKKKILIFGSNDHTNILIKLIDKFNINFKKIDYYEYKLNDIYNIKKSISFFNKIPQFNLKKYDKIFISSFQYVYEINDLLTKFKGETFSPYTNTSRSIIDYYFIKKFGKKYPLFSKKIF